MLPWVNCCLTLLRIVPEPIDDEAFCKPVVLTLAMLFDVAEMSDCAPLSPVSAV